MPSDKRDTPREFRAAGGTKATITAAPETGDGPKLKRFSGLAYSGAPMRPEGWWGRIVVDLNGVKVGSQHKPALRQHDHEQIVGHTDKVAVDEQGIHVEGPLSGEQQHVDKVATPAANGFPWQMSIGANPVRTSFLEAGEEAEVNGRTVTGPMTISHETELGEVSFVPLGADGDTSATVTGSKGKFIMFEKAALKLARMQGLTAAKYSDEQIDKMTDDEAKTALKECMKGEDDSETEAEDEEEAEAEDEDSETEGEEEEEDDEDNPPAKASKGGKKLKAGGGTKLKGKAVKTNVPKKISAAKQARQEVRAETVKELKRVNRITALAKEYKLDQIVHEGKKVDFATHAIEAGWSARDAELVALRSSRPGPGTGAGMVAGGHFHFGSTPEVTPQVLEYAVLDAGRHQFHLENDDFYKDHEFKTRRIQANMEQRIRAELKERYPDQVRQAAHTHFRGQVGLQQLLVLGARMHGYMGSDKITDGNIEEVLRFGCNDMGRFTIRAEGVADSYLPNTLANVQNKFALVGYLQVEQAWREIAMIRPTNDFKPTKSINLIGNTVVQQVPDSGDLQEGTITDQAFANQVDQYGLMLTIGRKPIINDDLSILTGAPLTMGAGASRGFNLLFWKVYLALASATADDGNAFWRAAAPTSFPTLQVASGPNLLGSGASSALSSTALQLAKQMYDKQVDPSGNPLMFDGMTPILLFPPELWLTAMELVDPAAVGLVLGAGTGTTSRQPNINMWKGRLKPVMSRYLSNATLFPATASATAWYNLMSPVAGSSVIEAAFLNGIDTPTVQTAGPDWNFKKLGVAMRVIFDYGANAQNFRAGVKSPGA
jgi:hypothetical protein